MLPKKAIFGQNMFLKLKKRILSKTQNLSQSNFQKYFLNAFFTKKKQQLNTDNFNQWGIFMYN